MKKHAYIILFLVGSFLCASDGNNLFFARPWKSVDKAALYGLELPTEPEAFPTEEKNIQTLVAYNFENQPCGHIEFNYSSGWIGDLYVKKELRGKKIGAALFARACKILSDHCERVSFLALSDAVGFYEKQGAQKRPSAGKPIQAQDENKQWTDAYHMYIDV